MIVSPKHIHFMGIAGSGMSAVAQITKAYGYQVTGCDLKLAGHSVDHLKNVDLLLVTPAVFYQNNSHPEVAEARKRGILMTWQDFMGKYLHTDKFLICVAGTHGKSTTTALAGLLLEQAGLDPTVEVGATVKAWHNNVRLGKSQYFISEADEFHDNFATYRPDIAILTLIEYDHPEYFGSYDRMLESYLSFLRNLKSGGTIIYNADSPGCQQLISQLTTHSSQLIPYTIKDFPKNLSLSQPGDHNKSNALAILRLGNHLAIDNLTIYSVLQNFSGLERRLDLIGEKNGVKVYDDYANHPSSYQATLQALKEVHPNSNIIAVIEPHTFSRLRSLLSELPDAVKLADEIIVSKIFASREQDPGNFTGQNIVDALHHPNAKYIPEFSDIVNHVSSHVKSRAHHVILVMGSGNSNHLARQIFASL
jgi:UDP-N-acetylmuramate--alanine ligase